MTVKVLDLENMKLISETFKLIQSDENVLKNIDRWYNNQGEAFDILMNSYFSYDVAKLLLSEDAFEMLQCDDLKDKYFYWDEDEEEIYCNTIEDEYILNKEELDILKQSSKWKFSSEGLEMIEYSLNFLFKQLFVIFNLLDMNKRKEVN